VIDLPLGHHPREREKYAVRWEPPPVGRPSVTIYRVREVYDGYTLVELELKTGRTHQIRVHLSHIGYPIVGDDMYGGRRLLVGDVTGWHEEGGVDPHRPLIIRQALHAAMLSFQHPITLKPVRFEAPLPPDMCELIALLRKHRMVERVNVAGAAVEIP
jgi:23S rRNA pseudouridine1911/1915/1917 synthase